MGRQVIVNVVTEPEQRCEGSLTKFARCRRKAEVTTTDGQFCQHHAFGKERTDGISVR